MAATDVVGKAKRIRDPHSDERTQVFVIDIKRAYLSAKTDEEQPTYVELPPEDADRYKGLCGRLLIHMYGTRKAAKGWHSEYADFLVDGMGFVKGNASACVFHHSARDITTSVYGDDFSSVGSKRNLDWFKAELEKRYGLVELARLGPGPKDDKSGKILNRIIRWTENRC